MMLATLANILMGKFYFLSKAYDTLGSCNCVSKSCHAFLSAISLSFHDTRDGIHISQGNHYTADNR